MPDVTGQGERVALQALRLRGVTVADELLQIATPEAIIATCHWWDKQTGVGVGLLVSRIRQGGIQEEEQPTPADKGALRRTRFAEITARYPEGTITETHEHIRQRRWPDDRQRCTGRLRTAAAAYPTLIAQCDECGLEVTYPHAQLHVLEETHDQHHLPPADARAPESQPRPNQPQSATPPDHGNANPRRNPDHHWTVGTTDTGGGVDADW